MSNDKYIYLWDGDVGEHKNRTAHLPCLVIFTADLARYEPSFQ